jgi:TPP-dependent trihydroxycyclohexane-1,2-dione (THcHDO) dehydratase
MSSQSTPCTAGTGSRAPHSTAAGIAQTAAVEYRSAGQGAGAQHSRVEHVPRLKGAARQCSAQQRAVLLCVQAKPCPCGSMSVAVLSHAVLRHNAVLSTG